MSRYGFGLWVVLLLGGCQSSHEQMLQQGHSAAYADGYQDGCGSGRKSAGLSGEFRKNVPRYLAERQYETGWDDGFGQCQVSSANQAAPSDRDRDLEARDRDWQRENSRDTTRAFRHN
nr:hypothetical protein [Pseudomonas sp.]